MMTPEEYMQVEDWIMNGMTPASTFAFTEGDCRLAGVLCELAVVVKTSDERRYIIRIETDGEEE